jgi:hypothetical protein
MWEIINSYGKVVGKALGNGYLEDLKGDGIT